MLFHDGTAFNAAHGGGSAKGGMWPSALNTEIAEIIASQLGAVGHKPNLKLYALRVAAEKFYCGQEMPISIASWSRYPEPS